MFVIMVTYVIFDTDAISQTKTTIKMIDHSFLCSGQTYSSKGIK